MCLFLPNNQDVEGSVTQPLHGTSSIEEGSIRYVPDTDFCGTDQFNYIITDLSTQLSDVATVTVNVACTAPVPPILNDDVAETDINEAISIPVLDNDENVPSSEYYERRVLLSLFFYARLFSSSYSYISSHSKIPTDR